MLFQHSGFEISSYKSVLLDIELTRNVHQVITMKPL